MILAIDPGTEQSAYVVYSLAAGAPGGIVRKGTLSNRDTLAVIEYESEISTSCVIEMVASYGMAVGREVFETVYWIGRFADRWEQRSGIAADRRVRRDVKMHLCHNNSAKDANIRAALIDKFGPGKEKAIGKKASPGPLYGVAGDEWAALALAVTFAEMNRAAREAA